VLNVHGGGDGLRGGAGGLFGPVENAAGAVVRPVRDFFANIGSLGSKDQQITDLQSKNDQLQQKLDSTDAVRSRLQQLESMWKIAGLGQYKTVATQVVASSTVQSFQSTVTIDVGANDGVTSNMTVVNGQGLVGKTVSVSATSSVVQLLTASGNVVGARIAGSNFVGILTGTGAGTTMQLQMVSTAYTPKVGDRLVKALTTGSAYVAGVPIGVVTAVGSNTSTGFQTATVRPYVDFAALDIVGVVLQGPRTDPRDSVLPPLPTPSPTPSPSSSSSPSTTPSGSPSPGSSGSPNPSSSG
jgi:rod shape-determining protein MreC